MTESAISIALEQEFQCLVFNTPSTFDSTNYRDNFLQNGMTKYSISDPWNSELIWGDSSPVNSWWRIQSGVLMKNPTASSVEAHGNGYLHHCVWLSCFIQRMEFN